MAPSPRPAKNEFAWLYFRLSHLGTVKGNFPLILLLDLDEVGLQGSNYPRILALPFKLPPKKDLAL